MNKPLSIAALAATVILTSFAITPAIAADVDPEALVNGQEALVGNKFPKERRSGAKGLCVEGTFTGDAAARSLSKASLLDGKTYPVNGRFSIGGGNLTASDKGKTARGLAFQVKLPNNEEFITTMISAPVFGISTPENFLKFLESRRPDPATGMPDPVKVKAFNDAHPDVKPQVEYLAAAPVPASYATVNYWGVNAFKVVNAEGKSNFVRWQFAPVAGLKGLTAEEIEKFPNDFLFDELRKRVASAPVSFDMKLQVAGPGDDTKNSTVVWPQDRQVVIGGRLTIAKVDAGNGGACKDFNFDPLVLPAGIEPSDDPILLIRQPAYAISFTRRLNP